MILSSLSYFRYTIQQITTERGRNLGFSSKPEPILVEVGLEWITGYSNSSCTCVCVFDFCIGHGFHGNIYTSFIITFQLSTCTGICSTCILVITEVKRKVIIGTYWRSLSNSVLGPPRLEIRVWYQTMANLKFHLPSQSREHYCVLW